MVNSVGGQLIHRDDQVEDPTRRQARLSCLHGREPADSRQIIPVADGSGISRRAGQRKTACGCRIAAVRGLLFAHKPALPDFSLLCRFTGVRARRRRAAYRVQVRPGQALQPGALDLWLTHRWRLCTRYAGCLLEIPVRHEAWPLRAVAIVSLEQSLPTAAGLSAPPGSALAHCSEEMTDCRAGSQQRTEAPRAARGGGDRAHCRLRDGQLVEKAMTKLLYKPVSVLVSVLGGMLAAAVFKEAWKIVGREGDAPKATDAARGWREILLAAMLRGAIFAVVKAVVDRGAAESTRKLTGVWPGDEGQPAGKPA